MYSGIVSLPGDLYAQAQVFSIIQMVKVTLGVSAELI